MIAVTRFATMGSYDCANVIAKVMREDTLNCTDNRLMVRNVIDNYPERPRFRVSLMPNRAYSCVKPGTNLFTLFLSPEVMSAVDWSGICIQIVSAILGVHRCKFGLVARPNVGFGFGLHSDSMYELPLWKSVTNVTRVGELLVQNSASQEDRQSGERKYRTEIVARDLLLLGPREGGGDQHPTRNENQDQPPHADSSGVTDQDIPF
jgi:hypothetical protein